jgi:hypothetical protein
MIVANSLFSAVATLVVRRWKHAAGLDLAFDRLASGNLGFLAKMLALDA